jgi:hypothetical protein
MEIAIITLVRGHSAQRKRKSRSWRDVRVPRAIVSEVREMKSMLLIQSTRVSHDGMTF